MSMGPGLSVPGLSAFHPLLHHPVSITWISFSFPTSKLAEREIPFFPIDLTSVQEMSFTDCDRTTCPLLN